MIIARVRGTLFATRQNEHFDGKKILVVQGEHPNGHAVGRSFLAIDRAQAGVGERVLVNKEGSSARLMFDDDEIPLQAVIVAVIDQLEIAPEAGNERGSP